MQWSPPPAAPRRRARGRRVRPPPGLPPRGRPTPRTPAGAGGHSSGLGLGVVTLGPCCCPRTATSRVPARLAPPGRRVLTGRDAFGTALKTRSAAAPERERLRRAMPCGERRGGQGCECARSHGQHLPEGGGPAPRARTPTSRPPESPGRSLQRPPPLRQRRASRGRSASQLAPQSSGIPPSPARIRSA